MEEGKKVKNISHCAYTGSVCSVSIITARMLDADPGDAASALFVCEKLFALHSY